MATEVAPSAMAELTDLGKCLMKHEVGGGHRWCFSPFPAMEPACAILTPRCLQKSFGGNTLHELSSWFLKPQKAVSKTRGHTGATFSYLASSRPELCLLPTVGFLFYIGVFFLLLTAWFHSEEINSLFFHFPAYLVLKLQLLMPKNRLRESWAYFPVVTLHPFPLGCLYGAVNYSLQFPGLEGYFVLPEDDHTALLAPPQTSMVICPFLKSLGHKDWLNHLKELGYGGFRVPLWPWVQLSPQVLSGTLLSDAVTWLFSSVLKGLQTHGQHDGCMASLVHLAFQIYEALVSGGGRPWLHPSQLLPLSEALSRM